MIKHLIALVSILLFTSQQTKLIKTRITEHISVKLPAGFKPVPPDEISSRYISYRTPIAYFTNQAEDVEFSVNNSATRWQESDLPLLKQLYESNIANLFDEVTFINQGMRTANKKDFIVFEFNATFLPKESFIGKDSPVRKYYLLYYTIQNGLVFIFSFSAPENQQSIWEGTANEIMQSIKMK